MGMVYAAGLSQQLGHAPAGTQDRLRELLLAAELPVDLPSFPRRAYLSGLRVDKKKVDARIHFVALRGIGEAFTVPLTPAEVYPARRGRRLA